MLKKIENHVSFSKSFSNVLQCLNHISKEEDINESNPLIVTQIFILL